MDHPSLSPLIYKKRAVDAGSERDLDDFYMTTDEKQIQRTKTIYNKKDKKREKEESEAKRSWTQKLTRRTSPQSKKKDGPDFEDTMSQVANLSVKAMKDPGRNEDEKRRKLLMEQRKLELGRLAQIRREKLRENEDLQMTREQLCNNVSTIILTHIQRAEKILPTPTEGALLFHEHNFLPHQWHIDTINGFAATAPIFQFQFEPVEYKEEPVEQQDVMRFMRNVLDKMQLTTECIVISLIYLEQVMITGQIEIRQNNWRPLVFTAILLASKFWEDVIWFNVDFVDNMELYPLKSINRMESEFISLCDYNIYVSAEKYFQYQAEVYAISHPQNSSSGDPFNDSLSNMFMNQPLATSFGQSSLPQTLQQIHSSQDGKTTEFQETKIGSTGGMQQLQSSMPAAQQSFMVRQHTKVVQKEQELRRLSGGPESLNTSLPQLFDVTNASNAAVPTLDLDRTNPLVIEKGIILQPNPEFQIKKAFQTQDPAQISET